MSKAKALDSNNAKSLGVGHDTYIFYRSHALPLSYTQVFWSVSKKILSLSKATQVPSRTLANARDRDRVMINPKNRILLLAAICFFLYHNTLSLN